MNSISGSLARTYGYDSAGNTLSYGSATISYNHRGRMLTASNGGVTATYIYNALGQRVKRSTSTETALYVYDEAGHLVGEYDAAGSLVQETVWLGDMPIATLRPNGSGGVVLYYVHADHLNTPRLVTDTSNNIRWSWESDAFGTRVPNEDPSSLGPFIYNLRFPGQQYDAVVGLHYNYFRDYDPAVGRYVQSDPIGLRGGLNTYAYANVQPNSKIDQRGLSTSVPGDGLDWGPSLTGPSICGADGGQKFPMSYGTFSFYFACRNHDACYGTCGRSRWSCDLDFLKDARDACKNPHLLDAREFSICRKLALRYFLALRWGGRGAYIAAQKESNCCDYNSF